MMTDSQIIETIRQSPGNKVKVAVTDIDGILRGKYISKEKFLSVIDGGLGFCNVVFGWDSSDVCYDNVDYTGWHTGYPDANAQIDLKTYRTIPWDDETPFFLADFVDSKQAALEICPRQLLKRVVAQVRDAGFEPQVALEFEWFNFDETPETLAEKGGLAPKPITPGMFGYSILRSSYNQPYFSALFDQLQAFNVPLEGLHTETGPGVYEAAIVKADALEAADRGVLFKTAVKEIAYHFGIIPSFMAKWDAKLPGCSGHIHQSLWKKEANVFYDKSAKDKMSDTLRSFIAGQLHCMPTFLPFFAPNVNSYKRLVEGLWAPTRVTWGVDNRTTALRAIPGSANSTRLETRVSGSDVNSYLAVAAALASGLYGIQQKLKLSLAPIVGSAYEDKTALRLPKNLAEATEQLSNCKIAKTYFGEQFVNHFVKTREWEWRQFETAVTSWELKRYFEIV